VLKHIVYEWVHPFCDGNGRSGRLILASDLGYNFDIANQVIDDNYIPMLREFMEDTDMNDLVASL
jgi:fido (protein-threonine AMPylation protein)